MLTLIYVVGYTQSKATNITIRDVSKCDNTYSQPEYRSPHGTQCCLCSLAPIPQAYLWTNVYKIIRKCAYCIVTKRQVVQLHKKASLNKSVCQYSPGDKAGWISQVIGIIKWHIDKYHCFLKKTTIPYGKTRQFIEQRIRLTVKACTICTQNSTAIPIDIIRFTTDTAFSWIPKIAITPCRSHKGHLFHSVTKVINRIPKGKANERWNEFATVR